MLLRSIHFRASMGPKKSKQRSKNAHGASASTRKNAKATPKLGCSCRSLHIAIWHPPDPTLQAWLQSPTNAATPATLRKVMHSMAMRISTLCSVEMTLGLSSTSDLCACRIFRQRCLEGSRCNALCRVIFVYCRSRAGMQSHAGVVSKDTSRSAP